jgi:AraC family transcriptional regulator
MLNSTSVDRNDALASLLAAATVALDTDRHTAKACIQRAAALLGIELSLVGNWAAELSCVQGGLALWQAKRLSSYIDDKLDSSIRATDLANVVQLSPSHFSRVFRKTFGEPPLRFIMQRRICRAQQLILGSQLSLSQVALECGMSDHAHFCRAFRRIVGMSPKTWRRQFAVGPASRMHCRRNRDSVRAMGAATQAQNSRESRLSQRTDRGNFKISKDDHAKHRNSEMYACTALPSRKLHEARLIADLPLFSDRRSQQSDQASTSRARSQGST